MVLMMADGLALGYDDDGLALGSDDDGLALGYDDDGEMSLCSKMMEYNLVLMMMD